MRCDCGFTPLLADSQLQNSSIDTLIPPGVWRMLQLIPSRALYLSGGELNVTDNE